MLSTASTLDVATVKRIVGGYGLAVRQALPMQRGYRNESYPVKLTGGQLANLILYKREHGIVRIIRSVHAVSGYLARQDFPSRQPLDGRIARLRWGNAFRYAGLYTYLPGETIAWEAYTRNHIKLLGQMLGSLHAALRGYMPPGLPAVEDVYLVTLRNMRRYFASPPAAEALARKLHISVSAGWYNPYNALLRASRSLSNRQVLHMDFVRSNILFAEAPDAPLGIEISGVLDFEKVAIGHPNFDLARTLAFLLVDCKYKPADKVRKYFLQSGYHRRSQASLYPVRLKLPHGRGDMLEMLVDLFLMYDFYKFLRHNPYESLPQNEHFVRTRDILLRHGVITTTHMV